MKEKKTSGMRTTHKKIVNESEKICEQLAELGVRSPTLARPYKPVVYKVEENGKECEYELICKFCHNVIKSRDGKEGRCSCSIWEKDDEWRKKHERRND